MGRSSRTIIRLTLMLTQVRHENPENDFFQGFAVTKSLVFSGGVRKRRCSVNLPSCFRRK